MRILFKIEYKGTNFFGWQSQINKRTVQSEIEKALFLIFNKKIKIYGSGRTDSGVHAIAQTAHFDLPAQSLSKFTFSKGFDFNKFIKAVNANLPNDIKVLNAKKVADNFHARFNVIEKIYLYRMEINSDKRSPIQSDFVGFCKNDLDISKIKEAANYFIGEHDFSSFCNSKSKIKDFKRKINYIKIKKSKNIVTFEFSGNGFLYNMIRIIIGTLVDVGTCKINPDNIKEILNSKSRTCAGKTVSASGLFLKKVRY